MYEKKKLKNFLGYKQIRSRLISRGKTGRRSGRKVGKEGWVENCALA
jgi:hypothetical protein